MDTSNKKEERNPKINSKKKEMRPRAVVDSPRSSTEDEDEEEDEEEEEDESSYDEDDGILHKPTRVSGSSQMEEKDVTFAKKLKQKRLNICKLFFSGNN